MPYRCSSSFRYFPNPHFNQRVTHKKSSRGGYITSQILLGLKRAPRGSSGLWQPSDQTQTNTQPIGPLLEFAASASSIRRQEKQPAAPKMARTWIVSCILQESPRVMKQLFFVFNVIRIRQLLDHNFEEREIENLSLCCSGIVCRKFW